MTDATILWSEAPQGSDEWLEVRRGRITGSQFKTARDKTAKGAPTAKAMLYARDTARERCGGRAAEVYVNAAMRFGSEQEPLARLAYEDVTGELVEQVGFAYTEDGRFGASVDGLVGAHGMVEIKTVVSSDTLFKAIVDGDHSEYIDQIDGCMWLLNLRWCDLCLWAPDLPEHKLTVVRIERDEARIEALVADLLAFDRLVCELADKLGRAISPVPPVEQAAPTSSAPPAERRAIEEREAAARRAEEEASRRAQEAIDAANAAERAIARGMVATLPVVPPTKPAVDTYLPATAAAVPPPSDEPPTLKLGDIGARLGFVLGQQFIADKLGVHAAARQKNAVLYHEADFARICDALAIHITTTKKENVR